MSCYPALKMEEVDMAVSTWRVMCELSWHEKSEFLLCRGYLHHPKEKQQLHHWRVSVVWTDLLGSWERPCRLHNRPKIPALAIRWVMFGSWKWNYLPTCKKWIHSKSQISSFSLRTLGSSGHTGPTFPLGWNTSAAVAFVQSTWSPNGRLLHHWVSSFLCPAWPLG